MSSQKFKTFKQASKASKPKTKYWGRKDRFGCGHDAASMALLPEAISHLQAKRVIRPRPNVRGVYRAASFNMTKEERILDDILFLVNKGYVRSFQEALDKVLDRNTI